MKKLVHRKLFAVLTAMTLAGSATVEAVAIADSIVKLADEPKDVIDLAGVWALQLDPKDLGFTEGWFKQPTKGQTPSTIQLPGSLQAQGFGDDVSAETQWTGGIVDRSWFDSPKYAKYRQPGSVKIPFWLQPDKHYVGVAWYAREVDIPEDWRGRRIVLSLERAHWQTRVWVDGRPMGTQDSLSTPHEYDLSQAMSLGKHRLSIRVDNRMIVNVGENAHSVSDHTQSNWNGMIGRLTLTARPPVWIDDVQVYPDIADKKALVRVRIGNATGAAAKAFLSLAVENRRTSRSSTFPLGRKVAVSAGGALVEVNCPLRMAPLWDEFDPALNRLTVELASEGPAKRMGDLAQVAFGLREFTAKGTQFAINGRPTFIRGTLECCTFPMTGYPPTDVTSWKRVLRTVKSYGLNSIRFHSWCPPEAAFVAADQLGVYIQVECAAWTSIGNGEPIDRWLYAEGERIIRAYGNHPSLVMMAYGNEPHGRDTEFLAKWVSHWKAKDPRRLYTSAAGWPAIEENQYHNIPEPRIQDWGAGLKSRINARPPETTTDYSDWVRKMHVPIVSHEIGQWCVYPNFDETRKYTGLLKAKNFEVFRDLLEAHHMGDQARTFFMASGKLQVLCYKEEIESALRTPGFGGLHLLALNDFPGQGTALVGCVDPFWDAKDYVTPEQFRRFCNATVPLARLNKRIWTTSETFRANIEVAHFSPVPMKNAVAAWRLVNTTGESVVASRLPAKTIPVGNGIALGTIEVPLAKLPSARKYRLVVGLEGTAFENDWDIWVFPDHIETAVPADVLVTDRLNAAARERLKAGGRVLLLIPPAQVESDVAIGFSSIFWNTAWTRGQAPHTLGIVCDPKHPAMTDFPTESHSDWQWWELIHGSAAMVLDGFPAKLRPLVQPIDTWFEARRLGLLFEAKVLGGKLLVSSMDLSSNLDGRVVARQMRHSVLRYMASDQFDPSVELSEAQVLRLMKASDVRE